MEPEGLVPFSQDPVLCDIS